MAETSFYRSTMTEQDLFWMAFGYFLLDYFGDVEDATKMADRFVAYVLEHELHRFTHTPALREVLMSDRWR